jgi:hypothetical protein
MKKILILLAMVALYSTVNAQFGYNDYKSNSFNANVVCIPQLLPSDKTVILGDFFIGGTYTNFTENEQEYTLEGGAGMGFNVSTTTTKEDHGVLIEFVWSVNMGSGYIDKALNVELLNEPITLPSSSGGVCDAIVYFKCKVTKLTIPASGITAGQKTFQMVVNAELTSF